MQARASMLGILLLLPITSGCGRPCDSAPTGEPIDLGIDTDLYAVVNLDNVAGERRYDFLAVGSSGTVVVWGTDHGGEQSEPFVEVFDLGDLDLRAAWIDKSDASSDAWRWWVVGDGGLIMTSNDLGATWDNVALPSSANLYGVAGIAGHPIVVGDDIIAWADLDWTWTELTPPSSGWGQLRGVSAYATAETRIEVVGLGGVIWATNDPSGAWTLEPSGVATDLLAVDYGVAVGAAGTLLIHGETGWTPSDTGVDVDIIDYEGGYALGADGSIYQVTKGEPLELADTVPGARGLTNIWDKWVAVGDDGSATSPSAGCQ